MRKHGICVGILWQFFNCSQGPNLASNYKNCQWMLTQIQCFLIINAFSFSHYKFIYFWITKIYWTRFNSPWKCDFKSDKDKNIHSLASCEGMVRFRHSVLLAVYWTIATIIYYYLLQLIIIALQPVFTWPWPINIDSLYTCIYKYRYIYIHYGILDGAILLLISMLLRLILNKNIHWTGQYFFSFSSSQCFRSSFKTIGGLFSSSKAF